MSDGPLLRVGLLLDEPIRLAGLCAVLEEVPGIVAEPVSITSALADASLGLVLLDMVRWVDSLDTLAALHRQRPGLKLIMMSAEAGDEAVIGAIVAGAKGYLDEKTTPEQLRQAIEVVQSGSIWAPRRILSMFVDRMLQPATHPQGRALPQFTRREAEVLRLLMTARSNREIAQCLRIEERTVKAYVARLMRKLGVGNRIALSMRAASLDLFSPEEDA